MMYAARSTGESFSSSTSIATLNVSLRSLPDPGSPLVSTGSEIHVPTDVSRREQADRDTLMQRRLVVVARNAEGFRTTLRFVDCQRNQTSCTMSSASDAFPSDRNAIP